MREKSAAELYNDKVSLIYEYDKKSPLFVRKAYIELENNNVERAVEILNSGLKIYPYYAAAHILLGKAFIQLGSYGHAIKAIKAGTELIHSKKTFDYYFKEIESKRNQRNYFEVTQRTSFLAPGLETPDEFDETNPPVTSPDNENIPIEDRLDSLANEMKNIKITPSSQISTEIKSFGEMDHESLIVSETLAKIYLAQGEYKEAEATYRKLIKKYPEKEEYFLSKIEEIKKNL